MAKKQKKLGLALGSGAVRGLVHVGIIKVLHQNDIEINYLAGSSIGAWVGAHYALNKDVDALEEYTLNKRSDKLSVFLEPSLSGGLVKGVKLEKLLKKWLGRSTFKDLKIPLRVVTVDLIKGKPYIFKNGDLAKAVHASMCIPTLFKPIRHKDMILVDGGVINPVPDDVVKKMGAEVVISVNLDHYPTEHCFGDESLSMAQTADRSFFVMRQYLSKYCLQSSDLIINPKFKDPELLSWTAYFRNKTGEKLIKIGEQYAKRALPKIKKLITP